MLRLAVHAFVQTAGPGRYTTTKIVTIVEFTFYRCTISIGCTGIHGYRAQVAIRVLLAREYDSDHRQTKASVCKRPTSVSIPAYVIRTAVQCRTGTIALILFSSYAGYPPKRAFGVTSAKI